MRQSSRPIEKASPVSEPAASGVVRIRCVFQPIVDLLTGSPVGYELLARGDASADSAEELFADARRRNATWDLEQVCRRAALRRIAENRNSHPNALFFLNVSPAVLEDPRFLED